MPTILKWKRMRTMSNFGSRPEEKLNLIKQAWRILEISLIDFSNLLSPMKKLISSRQNAQNPNMTPLFLRNLSSQTMKSVEPAHYNT